MPQATASYWCVGLNPDGSPSRFMWNCDACGPGMGLAAGEAETIAAMNEHMATAHPESGYVPAADIPVDIPV